MTSTLSSWQARQVSVSVCGDEFSRLVRGGVEVKDTRSHF